MNLTKKKFSKKSILVLLSIVVIAVLFIPMLYSYLYLGASWDPYGNLNKVPVAFVNQDNPVYKNDKLYNVGKEIEDNIKNNDDLNWQFLSYDEAIEGLDNSTYYAVIIVPADFSENISLAGDGVFKKGEIIYKTTPGKNYIFSQISDKIASNLKNEVTSSIAEETSKVLADNLYDVKDALKDASSGSNDLSKGLDKLYDGSAQLSRSTSKATEASKTLAAGLTKATEASAQLSDGTSSLVTGLEQLESGLIQKNDKLDELSSGAKSLSDNLTLAESASSDANDKLNKNLTAAAESIHQVSQGVSDSDSILSDVLKSNTLSASDREKLLQAKGILDQINKSDLNTNLETPLRNSANSLQPLVSTLTKLKIGSVQISNGLEQFLSALSENQSKAAEGVNELIAGALKIESGNSELSSGLNTLASKTNEFSSGLEQLDSGTNTLSQGLETADIGAYKLEDGLTSGFEELDNNLNFSSNDMSAFISDPVILDDESSTSIKYYGEGLAPYFISLSLWLGAMFINLILSVTKLINVIKRPVLKTFTGKFVAGSILVSIQSSILSYTLIHLLSIDTVNNTYFYLGNMLISIVFFSVMYGISSCIGILGTPIIFVAFILQLASSGGTFPIETAPEFYNIISSYFPMTYAIKILRMILSDITISIFTDNIQILLTFGAVFLLGGLVLNLLRRYKNGASSTQILSDSSQTAAHN